VRVDDVFEPLLKMYCRILVTMQPMPVTIRFFKDWNLQIRVSKSNSNKF
jgi:hypothetical protein